eukprot:NODE_5663_length_395_cov_71.442197_g4967_i0.p2 GENE.NODE_5663_length_395_cov_71.442197_g4967_i0~~NODE_5663_length_395_cov_71.442197_g4967_i0.p2  ORF type:complete len:68 (+),score=7.71 NODE_5663_length_395_cov_71.442197_g4967_i0:66-269(+)
MAGPSFMFLVKRIPSVMNARFPLLISSWDFTVTCAVCSATSFFGASGLLEGMYRLNNNPLPPDPRID